MQRNDRLALSSYWCIAVPIHLTRLQLQYNSFRCVLDACTQSDNSVCHALQPVLRRKLERCNWCTPCFRRLNCAKLQHTYSRGALERAVDFSGQNTYNLPLGTRISHDDQRNKRSKHEQHVSEHEYEMQDYDTQEPHSKYRGIKWKQFGAENASWVAHYTLLYARKCSKEQQQQHKLRTHTYEVIW